MDPLRTMFQHHAWATLTLLDHCATLSPERLSDTAPGTFGPILETLVHLLGADQRFLHVMQGVAPTPPIHEGMRPSFPEMKTQFEDQARQWRALLDRLPELNVTIPRRGSGPEVRDAGDIVMTQAIHHGNEHRDHVLTILGALGLEVPDLSAWAYLRTTRLQG
jgi:uncharacterized damage-inducible protein DinB